MLRPFVRPVACCWELLHPFAHYYKRARNKSQQCWKLHIAKDLRTTAAAAAKTSLKKRIRVLSIFIFDFPQSLTFSNVGELSWS